MPASAASTFFSGVSSLFVAPTDDIPNAATRSHATRRCAFVHAIIQTGWQLEARIVLRPIRGTRIAVTQGERFLSSWGEDERKTGKSKK
jgi:hypothetical protein